MTPKAHANRNLVELTRKRLMCGEISYEQAKDILRPAIEEMNERGAQIAKQYGLKFRKITFTSLVR